MSLQINSHNPEPTQHYIFRTIMPPSRPCHFNVRLFLIDRTLGSKDISIPPCPVFSTYQAK
jgi:hypothetical protein